MDVQELEARLNAHREVIIALMSAMMKDERFERLFDDMEQDVILRDGEEDPGIVPSRAFGPAAHVSEEIGRLLDAARKRSNHP